MKKVLHLDGKLYGIVHKDFTFPFECSDGWDHNTSTHIAYCTCIIKSTNR